MRRVAQGPERDAHVPLLGLADDATEHVRRVVQQGELFVVDGDGGETVGAVLVLPASEGEVELHLVAVAESHQGRGIGTAMVGAVLDELRADGVRRVLVGTSNAGIRNIRFYQLLGFRMLRVERDYFDEARGYDGTEAEDGIVHRDMIWFDLDL